MDPFGLLLLFWELDVIVCNSSSVFVHILKKLQNNDRENIKVTTCTTLMTRWTVELHLDVRPSTFYAMEHSDCSRLLGNVFCFEVYSEAFRMTCHDSSTIALTNSHLG